MLFLFLKLIEASTVYKPATLSDKSTSAKISDAFKLLTTFLGPNTLTLAIVFGTVAFKPDGIPLYLISDTFNVLVINP
jgi:hypothetical protein